VQLSRLFVAAAPWLEKGRNGGVESGFAALNTPLFPPSRTGRQLRGVAEQLRIISSDLSSASKGKERELRAALSPATPVSPLLAAGEVDRQKELSRYWFVMLIVKKMLK
jgi:hypothetical protein